MARRRFFVPDFAEGHAVLEGEDAQHLRRVLRAQPGQQFELSDDRSVQLAEVIEVNPRRVRFRLIEPIPAAPPPPFRVTLVAALIKFERFEWMIEKATELGVETILPVEAERTEKGLLRAAAKRVERWRKIARESSQQSRRDTLPAILDPAPLDATMAADCARRLVLDERRTAQPLAGVLRQAKGGESAAILVGPEGGWTEGEYARLANAWTPVSMGSRILRAETAAIAALAVVMNP